MIVTAQQGYLPPLASLASSDMARLRAAHDQEFDAIWRYARRLGLTPAEADDATQHVFIVLAAKLSRVEPGRERPFLYSSILRAASDVRRSAARRYETATLDETHPDSSPQPDELLEQRRQRDLLDNLLDAMPFELRAVFVLFEVEEFTMKEIATIFELPLGTVASRLRRAREDFEARSLVFRQTTPGSGP